MPTFHFMAGDTTNKVGDYIEGDIDATLVSGNQYSINTITGDGQFNVAPFGEQHFVITAKAGTPATQYLYITPSNAAGFPGPSGGGADGYFDATGIGLTGHADLFPNNPDTVSIKFNPADGTYTASDTVYGVNQNFPANSFAVAATCFASGTRILTSRGDVAVEDLEVGDLVRTTSGEARPIRWLGHRVTACANHPEPRKVQPVRIAAGAFGEGRPARDLLVSPDHMICVDLLGESLIPAKALINGSTINQEAVETVTYWHVELDRHDVLFAENLPAESYLDMGNRGFFAESGVVDLAAVPGAAWSERGYAGYCRPVHDSGQVVTFVAERLARRAEQVGWRFAALPVAEDVRLMVDGRAIRPVVMGDSVCFAVPAEARDVRLVSGASALAELGIDADQRRLGISLAALTIDDGVTQIREIALDDASLETGFHRLEEEAGSRWRWTDGEAVLPASLWAGCDAPFVLRIELAGEAPARWIAPASRPAQAVTERPHLRLAHAA